jgi:hypothetical protein
LAVVQIGIGVLDLSLGALAMYMSLPGEPSVDFVTLLVILRVGVEFGKVDIFQSGAAVRFQQGQDSTSNEASASVLSEESEKRGIGIGT